MLTFINKDLLLYWRNRREIAIAIFLPIILVVVLNFAFSSMFKSNSTALTLAVVNEDHEEVGIKQFEQLVTEMDLAEATAQAHLLQASQTTPVTWIYDYLNNPELSDWLKVYELNESEALQQLEQEEVDGIIRIPHGYTYNMLNAVVLGEVSAVELPLIVNGNSMNVNVLDNMMREFFDQVNYGLALQQVTGEVLAAELVVEGGREMIAGAKPFTMAQYFTIAMGLLFALFIAATIAERTGAEKRELVFYRITVTNTRPFFYLAGKTFSAFSLVWLQLMFVVIVSHLLLGVFAGKSLEFWYGFILVMTLYTMAIAGLSTLFTSIILRISSIDAANGLFLLITMVLGTIGGSFVPVYLLPEWLQRIGEWTPNGMTLAVLTEWIQFEQWDGLRLAIFALSAFFMVCFLVGIALYPRRGEA